MDKLQEKYVKMIKSKWCLRFIILFYIIFIMVPAYYTINYRLPPENKLNRTEGQLFLKHVAGKGSLIQLRAPEGKIQFSCMAPFGRSYSFPVRFEQLRAVEGNTATILWYRRPMYLGSYVNYIVQLQVGDRIIITQEKTLKSLHSGAILAASLSIIGLFIFYFIYKSNLKRAMRLERKYSND